jgi:outer membrane protein
MSTLTRSTPFALLGLCGFLAANQASAEVKIGVVNFQKVLAEAPQTKTAMQALENEFGERRRQMLAMQNDLKARDEKLQKEGAMMTETDRDKAEIALKDMQHEFSRKADEFQTDASTRRNEEISKLQSYLGKEIETYGSTHGFDLVITEVFYAKASLDITPQVLADLATKPTSVPDPAKPATK